MIKDEKLTQVIETLHNLTSGVFSDAIQRKLILDNLSEGVITVDPELKIVTFNKAAEKITGIGESETIGKSCLDLFNSSGQEDFCLLGQVVEKRTSFEQVTRHLRVGDNLFPVLVSASPLVDSSGKLIGGIQSFQEITEIFHRQLILDSIFDGVFTVDLDFRITFFNQAAIELTGYSLEDVLGRRFTEVLMRDENISLTDTALAQAMESGRPVRLDSVYLEGKDQRILPVSVNAAPLIDARGNFFGGVESFRDNTNRIQTDLILDHVVDGVFTVDPEGIITSFNKAAERITGYSSQEVIGGPCHQMFASSECAQRKQEMVSSLEGLTQWIDKKIYFRGKGDRIVPVSMSSVPMTGRNQQVIGMVQTFRDITDQLEQQYILDSVADGVFTVDKNFFFTSFNKAAERITGYTSEEILGKTCRDVFHTKICASGCPLAKAIKTQSKITVSKQILHGKNGKKIPVNVSATALMDESGNIIGGVETFKDLTEVTKLRRQLSEESKKTGIISRSPKMQKILSVLPEFAKSESTILILGESGTGKELIAQIIHKLSPRKDKPFVAVNSGALPDTLLESELFGYKAGAFTDARKDRKGRFATAEGGSLFLDEIGDISQAMQVKLLRVIQARMYEPLGSNKPIKTDVRIITATNRKLGQMVKDKEFREDLYYRLNVVKIELPPLRERMEDLPILTDHFIQRFNRLRNKEIKGISEEALAILKRYDFPGNIRELENIIEYTFVMCRDDMIYPRHLPEDFIDKDEPNPALKPVTLAEVEKQAILDTLKRNEFKKMKTCRELGISKDTLRRKLKAYGADVK
ncbi:MAG: PAS domain-containing protein [Desulfobulbaceae bacterium]|nr:PAS domain-containing protein [Desulfobulbaceae bacterium]